MFSYGLSYMDVPVWADQEVLTYISSVPTLDAVLKTCQEQQRIGTDGEKESGNTMLSAWLDNKEIVYADPFNDWTHHPWRVNIIESSCPICWFEMGCLFYIKAPRGLFIGDTIPSPLDQPPGIHTWWLESLTSIDSYCTKPFSLVNKWQAKTHSALVFLIWWAPDPRGPPPGNMDKNCHLAFKLGAWNVFLNTWLQRPSLSGFMCSACLCLLLAIWGTTLKEADKAKYFLHLLWMSFNLYTLTLIKWPCVIFWLYGKLITYK